ncbi:MAG: cyclic nucleotide-binding domain-containing protein, partial [Actinomycetota bacterium]
EPSTGRTSGTVGPGSRGRLCRCRTAGDPAEEMYVVGDGEVELLAGETVVEVVPAGRPFGELGLIDEAPRALDARARDRAVVAPISAERYTWLVEQRPEFALSLLRLLAHRLRNQTGT